MLLVDGMVFTVIPCEFIVIHSESMRRWTYQTDQMMVVTVGTILITVNIRFVLKVKFFQWYFHETSWYIMVYYIYIMLNDHHIVTVYVTISIAVHPRRVHHRPGPSWAMVSSGHWDSPLFCSRVAAPVPCFLLAKTNMEQSSDGFDCIYISIIIYIYE